MDRPIKYLLAAFLCATTARADLQLMPKLSSYELDGATFRILAFSDGLRDDITYAPPPGWDYFGSSAKLTLRPPMISQAEGSITTTKLPTPGVFDEEAKDLLTRHAMESVPSGSTDVTLVSQEMDPVIIEQKETFLVIVKYASYAQHYRRSMLFLNRGTEQLCFQLVSPEESFEDLQRAFLGSQFSWQHL
jgi:hypothetical protein